MTLANAMSIEQEHPLQFLPKIHEGTPVYIGKMGKCMCGNWECWSTNQDEVVAAHTVHIEHVRDQRAREEARFKIIRQTEHRLIWRDETFSPMAHKYQAWCSGPACGWSHEGSQVAVLSAFQKHQHEL